MTLLVVLAVLAVLVSPSRPQQGLMAPADRDRSGGGLRVAHGSDATARTLLSRARGRLAGRQVSPSDGLADLVELLVPPLRAGAAPHEALRIATLVVGDRAGLSGLTQALRSAAEEGRPLAEAWAGESAPSGRPPRRELDFLARAWTLSEETGVPLAEALATAARVMRARQAAERSLAAATAGARASMVLLALLPAAGPAIGLLFGFSPLGLYTGSPAAAASVVTGVLLGLAGLAWSRSILRRAVRPQVVS